MNINTKALKGVIEEVEASKLRQKAEADFQREAIKRAVKEHQLDGKAIRIVLQRRAMGDQKRDEQDYFVHAYEHALAGKKLAAEALERGATVREAAAIGGISTGAAGNLAKVVQKSPKMDTPHDADGVVTETQGRKPEDGDGGITESCGGRGVGDNPAPHGLAPEEKGPGTPDNASSLPIEAGQRCGTVGNVAIPETASDRMPLQPPPQDPFINADEAPTPRSVGAVVREPATERGAPTPFMGDDPGEIPAHLRGPSPANRSLRP